MAKEIFIITDLSKTTDIKENLHIRGHLKINWTHDIFSGHFPDNPVLPGVVQVQMITEVFNKTMNDDFILARASSIKYPNMVVPKICDTLTFDIHVIKPKTSGFGINATLVHENLTFLKLKGHFVPADDFKNLHNS